MFSDQFGYVFVILIEGKSGINISQSIKKYFKEIGIPLHLICDQAQEQVRGDARLIYNEAGCHEIELEKGTPCRE